ncbi:MAG: hypothetical protein COB76_06155 [Alphaproteobacteria bacterium]|nr:MAG: hypothetical protein COB76_06155 [Alphaproteobacteria bacterium]
MEVPFAGGRVIQSRRYTPCYRPAIPSRISPLNWRPGEYIEEQIPLIIETQTHLFKCVKLLFPIL